MIAGAAFWSRIGTKFLPFADAATLELPLGRLLRLSLFQVSVGMAAVLLTGTLNRVMIVELGMSVSLVAAMVAIPLLFAPFRALIGHRSDHHRSVLGWKRVPYIWFGSLLQFGGFAMLPFGMLVMAGGGAGPGADWSGHIGSAVGFLMVGAGMHMTQTAGLALATDLAPVEARPRVVALLYVMLLVGMLVSAIVIGQLLREFSPTKLVQVISGVAMATMVLNVIALWKQEVRNRTATSADLPRPAFAALWAEFIARPRATRLLVAVGMGAAAFSMQDVLLEPYGGSILGLSVGATTSLTALWAAGMLAGFTLAARAMASQVDPLRLAGFGGVVGIGAFLCVLFAAPLNSVALLGFGAAMIGLGGGLFSVGTMVEAMGMAEDGRSGLALGAWGSVQATCAGAAIAIGGIARDVISTAAVATDFGSTLANPATGYGVVYCVEILLLLGTLVALGPLVRGRIDAPRPAPDRFGLGQFPI
ncbi:BCD family MFS transporter [Sphingomonas sp. 37zxx]|uniref:BCD family MFS transporter n=1 Tax=Sphingomonas sp. 37zxx TaxID=1550073 RepID=UPI00053BFBC9|nr:BCD family MFS transporter [Sphingomonas sp. 37zxx]